MKTKIGSSDYCASSKICAPEFMNENMVGLYKRDSTQIRIIFFLNVMWGRTILTEIRKPQRMDFKIDIDTLSQRKGRV